MYKVAAVSVLLACLAGTAIQAAADNVDGPRKIRLGAVDVSSKAPTSCGDNKEKHDCLDIGAQEGDCAWCKGDYMPGSCVSTSAAKYIPEQVAKCKLPKHKSEQVDASNEVSLDKKGKKPKAPTSCGDNKEKHDCLKLGAQEGDCAWCKGDYMPGSCVSTMAAKFIPEMVAHCKLPKKHKEVELAGAEDDDDDADADDSPDRKAPLSCLLNKEKHDCLELGAQLEGDCAWCKGDYMAGSCISTWAAKMIPESIAKCKLPKKHDDGGDDDDTKDDNDDDDDDDLFANASSDWPSGGGDWPSGGGDWPSGGGGDDAGCQDIKKEKKCLHKKACAWCENSYYGTGCVSEQMAETMKYYAKCKMGKKKKKNANVATS